VKCQASATRQTQKRPRRSGLISEVIEVRVVFAEFTDVDGDGAGDDEEGEETEEDEWYVDHRKVDSSE